MEGKHGPGSGYSSRLDLKWSRYADSNRRPTHYECVALPTELYRLVLASELGNGRLDSCKSGWQRYAWASDRLRPVRSISHLAQEFCHFHFAGRVAGLEKL